MKATRCTYLHRSAALAALGVGIVASASPAYACGQDAIVGSVCAFAGPYCPAGYVPAAGGNITINGSPMLVAIMGENFGTGASTGQFRLPNLSARAAIGPSTDLGIPVGQSVGAPSLLVELPNMPSHSHDIDWSSSSPPPSVQGSSPINTAAATTAPSLAGGAIVYLASATAGSGTSSLKGLYTTQPPGRTNVAVAPVAVPTSPTQPLSGFTQPSGNQQALPFQSPALGMTYCIAAAGKYYPPPSSSANSP